jgi:hypothetical protein
MVRKLVIEHLEDEIQYKLNEVKERAIRIKYNMERLINNIEKMPVNYHLINGCGEIQGQGTALDLAIGELKGVIRAIDYIKSFNEGEEK